MKVGNQLFLEDRAARTAPSSAVSAFNPARSPGRQRREGLHRADALLIHLAESRVNVVVEDQANWAGKPLYEIEAWDLYLEVPDRDNKSARRRSCSTTFVQGDARRHDRAHGPLRRGQDDAALGAQRLPAADGGQVRVNGESLYTIYDALRGSIGYVPQDDIVHPELTVFEAMKYSARFACRRTLAKKRSTAASTRRCATSASRRVQNLQIGKPEKKVLSGGQRKRVNIALELVTDPVILFLDEPTSGLAADDTMALIDLLADLAKKTGKTIIVTIHQPAKDEFEKFNLCLHHGLRRHPHVLRAHGGPCVRVLRVDRRANRVRPVEPEGRQPARHVRHAQRARAVRAGGDEAREPERCAPGRARRGRAGDGVPSSFAPTVPSSSKCTRGGVRSAGAAPLAASRITRDVAVLRQLGLLLSRYWRVKLRDRMGAAIMFLQAPIIGVLLWTSSGGRRRPCRTGASARSRSCRPRTTAKRDDDLLNSMKPTPITPRRCSSSS